MIATLFLVLSAVLGASADTAEAAKLQRPASGPYVFQEVFDAATGRLESECLVVPHQLYYYVAHSRTVWPDISHADASELASLIRGAAAEAQVLRPRQTPRTYQRIVAGIPGELPEFVVEEARGQNDLRRGEHSDVLRFLFRGCALN